MLLEVGRQFVEEKLKNQNSNQKMNRGGGGSRRVDRDHTLGTKSSFEMSIAPMGIPLSMDCTAGISASPDLIMLIAAI
jgi:hypothetical protein